jgi:hypothetical protein
MKLPSACSILKLHSLFMKWSSGEYSLKVLGRFSLDGVRRWLYLIILMFVPSMLIFEKAELFGPVVLFSEKEFCSNRR